MQTKRETGTEEFTSFLPSHHITIRCVVSPFSSPEPDPTYRLDPNSRRRWEIFEIGE